MYYANKSDRKDLYINYIKESIENDLSNIKKVYINPGGNFWVIIDKSNNK